MNISAIPDADKLPYALCVLLENVVRCAESDEEAALLARAVIQAGLSGASGAEISYMPSRVLFQDFTGVPVFVDFAAMRDACAERGADPMIVNPLIPATLIIDHSVIADESGCAQARSANEALEARRNRERFAFLKWASRSFDNVEIVPPGGGICHQLNMERFATVVGVDALYKGVGERACYDTLVGTDSHTTTVNGIGVMAWGVGGIEAEAAALGQPISMLVPPVVELRLTGRLGPLVSGMDAALTVCEILRREGVVGALVEATGEGVSALSATQRACIANMTPEYGATTTLFPVDDITLDYLRLTGRAEGEVAFCEAYHRAQGTFGSRSGAVYAKTICLDLSTVEPSLAGPSRPHNRVGIEALPARFEENCQHELDAHAFGASFDGVPATITDGSIALAAITSCTTATDAAMMVAAGLLALRAREANLASAPWVKCVLAPGSHAAEDLLTQAGLLEPLQELGFFTCGFGCMACIGNTGEIKAELKAHSSEVEYASVLSGNRNFDGRISPDVAQNYLAQPALVVAYAIAGSVRADLTAEPLGFDAAGAPVMLADIMPTADEIDAVLAASLERSLYETSSEHLMEGSPAWQEIEVSERPTFSWDEMSTYVRRAPYFELARRTGSFSLDGARMLCLLGDFVTTDHISPAGTIAKDSAAADYLRAHGVAEQDFNTYGTRRGNHEVMARGAFGNTRIENRLAGGEKGPVTVDVRSGKHLRIFDAAMSYAEAGIPLVVVAGSMYGSGSSRDWAAKGPLLQGVRAVIAESFERIHRSNLVQMGIVPLQFAEGQGATALGLDGTERVDIAAFSTDAAEAPSEVEIAFTASDGTVTSARATVRVDTPQEWRYIASGGILPFVLDMLAE